jgi:hypothetical protein
MGWNYLGPDANPGVGSGLHGAQNRRHSLRTAERSLPARRSCLTMRDKTEWVETVATGWNMLVGSDSKNIVESVHSFAPSGSCPDLYGDGFAAEKCVDLFVKPRCRQFLVGLGSVLHF